ncbi:hypothetical protein M422DRAFT_268729 [Sphaerobolus stellatus SS14]|uniref:Unplaced genomic scaffold SPHSTscaffold_200, whole genome shotgun sequence n=1 Tax=Sphaerobolus stellatus (strain SS14) TaxID=990650 RepID=A0A0C9U664_SPHS4|nr:hypothetical protein M422DRAFT_268729 [Sphaerobolus stellatus SS14]
MPDCPGCNVSFSYLSAETKCGRCIKLKGKTAAESQLGFQCRGCGILYKNLNGIFICGRCAAKGVTIQDTFEEELDDIDVEDNISENPPVPSTSALISRAHDHRSEATTVLLQKQPKNQNILKADDYKKLKQNAHQKAASINSTQLKSKEDKVITFMVYLKYFDAVRKARKILFREIFKKNITFGKYFDGLCASNALCKSDINRRSMSIKLSLYQTTEATDSMSDNSAPKVVLKGQKCKKQQCGSAGKRWCAAPDSDSSEPESEDDMSGVGDTSQHNKLDNVSMTGRQVTRSLAASRKAVNEDLLINDSGEEETDFPGSIEEPSSIIAVPFVTPYHCQPTFQGSSFYDIHSFKRMICLVPPNGEILLQSSNVTEFVAVPKNWSSYRNSGKGAMGGYLGKGTRKWAFEGYLVNSPAALFQPGGLHYYSGVDDTKNEIVLCYEFMSLMKADYHLQVFKARAMNYKVPLPLLVHDVPPKPLPGIPETRSMLNKTFLASPFIDMKNCKERRFTGRDGGGRSASDWQEMDYILSAFTHAVLVDSNHTIIITDLQDSISGLWSHEDDGFNIINRFLKSHRCNDYCRNLQLEGASPASVPRLEYQDTVTSPSPEPQDSQTLLPSIRNITSTEFRPSTSSVLLPPLRPFPTCPSGPLRFGGKCLQCQYESPTDVIFTGFPI